MPNMKRSQLLITLTALCGFVLSANSQLLHDTFADGSRAQQNLPTESAWFANSTAGLVASPNLLAGTVPAGSALWLTYFTPCTGQGLNVGDSLVVTMNFNLASVAAQNSSRGVRIGLFDFSSGTRAAADGFSTGSGAGAPGAGVTGYLLN